MSPSVAGIDFIDHTKLLGIVIDCLAFCHTVQTGIDHVEHTKLLGIVIDDCLAFCHTVQTGTKL